MLLNTEKSHVAQGFPDSAWLTSEVVTWLGLFLHVLLGNQIMPVLEKVTTPVWPNLFSYYDIVNLIDPQITISSVLIFQTA